MRDEIDRRLGRGTRCPGKRTCPNIFKLKHGRGYAVVGIDRTEELEGQLPEDAGRDEHERIVVIPEQVMRDAQDDL